MAVDDYALTSLTNLKTALGVSGSTDDTLLEQCINRASDLIEGWLGYRVRARDYTEWLDLSRMDGPVFRLSAYPVNTVRSVAVGIRDAITLTCTDPTLIGATVSCDGSKVRVVTTASDGTDTTSDLSLGTYKSVSTLAAAIDALAGVSATALIVGRSAQLHITPGSSFLDRTVSLTVAWDEGTGWRLDETNGVMYLTLPAWWMGGAGSRMPQRALVEYNAGEATTPDDIEQACITVASYLYNSGQRDPGLQSESLGDYSYTTKAGGDNATLSGQINDLLASRRRIR